MDSDCSSCIPTMTQTPTFGRSPSTRFPGDTHAQSIGTNWISSYSGVPLSRTFHTHARTTVRIATQTNPWCVVRSDCNQRGSIALRNSGIHILRSARCHNQTSCHNLRRLLRKSKVSATEKWEILRDTMHRTALATFGKKTSKTHDLFDAKSSEMRPVIEAMRTALMEYKRSLGERNLQILRAARSKVQQAARRCANKYWTQLCQDIQTAAITGNLRGMYDGIKKALGPTQCKTAPLKSSSGEKITDKGQQMERWVERYSDLYSRENTVSAATLDVIECLPTMDELDSEPSVELSKAIDSLASGKAPGNGP